MGTKVDLGRDPIREWPAENGWYCDRGGALCFINVLPPDKPSVFYPPIGSDSPGCIFNPGELSFEALGPITRAPAFVITYTPERGTCS